MRCPMCPTEADNPARRLCLFRMVGGRRAASERSARSRPTSAERINGPIGIIFSNNLNLKASADHGASRAALGIEISIAFRSNCHNTLGHLSPSANPIKGSVRYVSGRLRNKRSAMADLEELA